MTYIIGMHGRKQSGKSTGAEAIKDFCELKTLAIDQVAVDFNDEPFTYKPHVGIFNFADALKDCVSKLFNLNIDVLNGSNEDKNSLTDIAISDVMNYSQYFSLDKVEALYARPEKRLTHREIMQLFGGMMRSIDKDCFINYTMRAIENSGCNIAVIADCRVDNEVDAILNAGGFIFHLKRRVDNDTDVSEQIKEFSESTHNIMVINNQNICCESKNEMITRKMDELVRNGLVANLQPYK